jgi:hypothetical protein
MVLVPCHLKYRVNTVKDSEERIECQESQRHMQHPRYNSPVSWLVHKKHLKPIGIQIQRLHIPQIHTYHRYWKYRYKVCLFKIQVYYESIK